MGQRALVHAFAFGPAKHNILRLAKRLRLDLAGGHPRNESWITDLRFRSPSLAYAAEKKEKVG